MNRAKFVICRSGYTSMMELAELNKHQGLFIPTPGQPEQEYLSYYYEKIGWFHSESQYNLNLTQDIPRAMKYKGFPSMPTTKDNVLRLYNDLLAQYLD
jgi:UDP-N-acetylglucosamine:LPS N-acetylglucosamine transferase